MLRNGIQFSVVSDAAWAPGLLTRADWQSWAHGHRPISGDARPLLDHIAPLHRRRASPAGRLAMEVASQCLTQRSRAPSGNLQTPEHPPCTIPSVYASRHGECARAVELLDNLATGAGMSPGNFSLSVHNASAGLLSIAKNDRSNHLAIAAGASSTEHGLIEACSLLADGEPEVLLVVFDSPPPPVFADYADIAEPPFAWAWLLQPPQCERDYLSLSWSAANASTEQEQRDQVRSRTQNRNEHGPRGNTVAGLDILGFHLRKDAELRRNADGRCWTWRHHA